MHRRQGWVSVVNPRVDPELGCARVTSLGDRTLSGLVTLVLLAVLTAYIATRVLTRLGVSITQNRRIGIMFVFVVVTLMLWGQTLNK